VSPLEDAILALSIANLGLAVAVGVIYWRNHRAINSPFTWALALFATFLVLHNAFQIYEFFAMMGFGGFPERLLVVEGLLEAATTVALLTAALR
jgi:hypothetical protein